MKINKDLLTFQQAILARKCAIYICVAVPSASGAEIWNHGITQRKTFVVFIDDLDLQRMQSRSWSHLLLRIRSEGQQPCNHCWVCNRQNGSSRSGMYFALAILRHVHCDCPYTRYRPFFPNSKLLERLGYRAVTMPNP